MVKRWVGRAAVWWSRHGHSPSTVGGCILAWSACFIWSLTGTTWWAPALSAVAAVLGAMAARRCRRAGMARRAAEAARSALVAREVASSLTDEALAWAVGTWRKRYL